MLTRWSRSRNLSYKIRNISKVDENSKGLWPSQKMNSLLYTPSKQAFTTNTRSQKNVAEQMKNWEKQLSCKSIAYDLISDIVEKDPVAMSEEVVESLVSKVELCLKHSANATKLTRNGKRLKIFEVMVSYFSFCAIFWKPMTSSVVDPQK